MKPTIYGIKNCDTMKKAFAWLEQHSIDYDFHDYKKLGADQAVVTQAFAEHGWQNVINQRGMTWRQLSDQIKNNMNETNAMAIALEKPSIIKRPLMLYQGKTHLGFSDSVYAEVFAK